jgi:endonuclease-3
VPRTTKAIAAAPHTFERLHAAHPDAHCELVHQNPFQLIVATVLSAQATDVIVNKVTPDLFAKYPDPAALAAADPAVLEQIIGRLGMFRQKTKNIVGLAKKLVAEHGGDVPRSLAELVKLPGVGRKTANVVLGVAFQSPEGVVVDTHVQRISQRLGWTKETTPEKIELELMTIFPRRDWDMLSHVLIFHGRRVCYARKPSCATCTVTDVCPSAYKAELVGRKPGRAGSDAGSESRVRQGRGAAKGARGKAPKGRAKPSKGAKVTAKAAHAAKGQQKGRKTAR